MISQENRCFDHYFETSKVIVFLAGVKAKGSQCICQRIQGVLAHLLEEICLAGRRIFLMGTLGSNCSGHEGSRQPL